MNFIKHSETLLELSDCKEFCDTMYKNHIEPILVEEIDEHCLDTLYRNYLAQATIGLLFTANKQDKIKLNEKIEYFTIRIAKENLPKNLLETQDEDLLISVTKIPYNKKMAYGIL